MSLAIVNAFPPNALIIIEDTGGGVPPATMGKGLIEYTDSCIAVGCSADSDTTIKIGRLSELNMRREADFSGTIRTPNRAVSIRNVYLETIAEAVVEHEETRLLIWVNDKTEPTLIVLGLI